MRGEYRPGQYRDELTYGLIVEIVLKQDQKKIPQPLKRGKIQDILTNKGYHPRGCKIRLFGNDGTEPDENYVGRVQNIIGYDFEIKE